MPCPCSSTICVRRQETTDPLLRQMIVSRRCPSPSSTSLPLVSRGPAGEPPRRPDMRNSRCRAGRFGIAGVLGELFGLREVMERLVTDGRWKPGDPDALVVLDVTHLVSLPR